MKKGGTPPLERGRSPNNLVNVWEYLDPRLPWPKGCSPAAPKWIPGLICPDPESNTESPIGTLRHRWHDNFIRELEAELVAVRKAEKEWHADEERLRNEVEARAERAEGFRKQHETVGACAELIHQAEAHVAELSSELQDWWELSSTAEKTLVAERKLAREREGSL